MVLDFRVDRFLTLNLFYPLSRVLPKRRSRRIPILMYHSISGEMGNAVHPYYQTNTSPQIFAEHMKFLHDNEYSVINLKELSQFLNDEKDEDRKAVVLTFDDGFSDFYTEAFPILEQHGYPASVFLPTAYIGNKPIKFLTRDCLTWKEIRFLNNCGVTFGSHTVNHFKLHGMAMDVIKFEIENSKKRIEYEIGDEIETFSYPFAFPEKDRQFIKKLKTLLLSCGYKRCLSTIIGTENDKKNFFFKRIPVNHYDDIKMFKAKLEGLYDWVHNIQYLNKTIGFYRAKYITKKIGGFA
jgi:peptidoglycan/xylan/chitin deacetylase (PgdA/CDA1 family)